MSVFDHALDNLFVGGRPDKKLQRLFEQGELVPATIYAIRVEAKGGDADEFSYGLDLQTAGGQRRMSVRQQLTEEPQLATLGAHVMARYLDDMVVIDWTESLKRMGVERDAVSIAIKTLKQPLEAGIEDQRINKGRLNKWKTGKAKIISFSRVEPLIGSSTQNWDLEVELDAHHESRRVTMKREFVPPYAQQLLAEGAELPASIDPKDHDRVTIDWPAAAEDAANAALRS